MRCFRYISIILCLTFTGFSLTACATREEKPPQDPALAPHFGYVLSQPMVTINAGTDLGVATDAAKVSSRLFPGAFIAGPNTQLLPNADLVTVVRNPEFPQFVDYFINEDATFSDNVPVTCDDFFMTWVAATHKELFGADMPLFSQVNNVICEPQNKHFVVEFAEGFGDRFQELFTAGTVLPTHTVEEKAGVGKISDVIASGDEVALNAIARAWQEVFRIDITNPALVPTSGPYRIKRRGSSGELVLITNPLWKGDKPAQDLIYVWPHNADIKKMVKAQQLSVAELDINDSAPTLGLKAPEFIEEQTISARVDTLRLSREGIFSQVEARQAMAACINRGSIVETISAKTQAPVVATGLRVVPPSHPLAAQLAATNEEHSHYDPEYSRSLISGMTVRIGFLEDNSRYQMIVDDIVRSCATAEVTIIPVPLSAATYGTLGADYDVLLDTRSAFGRNSATNAHINSRLRTIREAEDELAQEATTVPLITEPRTLIVEEHIRNVVDSGNDGGASWNMDRWKESDISIHEEKTTTEEQSTTSEEQSKEYPGGVQS